MYDARGDLEETYSNSSSIVAISLLLYRMWFVVWLWLVVGGDGDGDAWMME